MKYIVGFLVGMLVCSFIFIYTPYTMEGGWLRTDGFVTIKLKTPHPFVTRFLNVRITDRNILEDWFEYQDTSILHGIGGR